MKDSINVSSSRNDPGNFPHLVYLQLQSFIKKVDSQRTGSKSIQTIHKTWDGQNLSLFPQQAHCKNEFKYIKRMKQKIRKLSPTLSWCKHVNSLYIHKCCCIDSIVQFLFLPCSRIHLLHLLTFKTWNNIVQHIIFTV